MFSDGVEKDLRRVGKLVDLIAREHDVEAPTDLTVASLLAFLASVEESAAEFFTIAFIPWSSEVEFEAEVEKVREAFKLLGGLSVAWSEVLGSSREQVFVQEESTEQLGVVGK